MGGYIHSSHSEFARPQMRPLSTSKIRLLLSVPSGVVTSTVPVVAPKGTVASIAELETTWNSAVETDQLVRFLAAVLGQSAAGMGRLPRVISRAPAWRSSSLSVYGLPSARCPDIPLDQKAQVLILGVAQALPPPPTSPPFV